MDTFRFYFHRKLHSDVENLKKEYTVIVSVGDNFKVVAIFGLSFYSKRQEKTSLRLSLQSGILFRAF